MKWLRKFNESLEGLENEINIEELEDILIDFIHMGVDYDIKIGNSLSLDFNKLNKLRENGELSKGNISINSADIDDYKNPGQIEVITIHFNDTGKIKKYKIDEFREAYDMLLNYLKIKYNLITAYIYVNYHWTYQYFENIDMLILWVSGNREFKRGTFEAHKIVLAFTKKK